MKVEILTDCCILLSSCWNVVSTSKYKRLVKISSFIATIYSKRLLIRKGIVGSLKQRLLKRTGIDN
jgi:hypothetical protein